MKEKFDKDKILEDFKRYSEKNLKTELEHFEKLRIKSMELIEREHDLIGRILKYHLIIESYINKAINYYFDLDIESEKVNFTFNQKLNLLKKKGAFMIFHSSFKELNKIRNKLAHNLNAVVEEKDIINIKKFTQFYIEKLELDVGDIGDYLEIYTIYMSVMIDDECSEIGEKRRDYINKNAL